METTNIDSWNLLKRLRSIIDKYGDTITPNEYDYIKESDKPSRGTLRRYIGGWQVCLNKARELDLNKPSILSASSSNKLINVIRLCDWHIPFHDEDALHCAIDFCNKIQPDIIVMDELNDWYVLSRFDQDPKRINSLQDELDITEHYLNIIRQLCPNSRIILLESNHQERMRKYIWRTAGKLVSLRCLETPSLLSLDKYDIELFETFTYKDFLFKHGNIIRPHSSYTARMEFEQEGMSGCSGHSHRIGQYFVTKRGGEYTWLECGCLCKREDVEYIRGTSNWQHGIGFISFKEDSNHFVARVLPIIDNEILFS